MTAVFASLFADAYKRFGVDATYQGPSPCVPVGCRVRFVFAGQTDVGHGTQGQAIIKVLWSDFPQHPTGIFTVNGVEWKVLEAAGAADGYKEGIQRALLVGNGRRFRVEK